MGIMGERDESAVARADRPSLGYPLPACYKSPSRDDLLRRLARLRDERAPAYARSMILDVNYLYHRQQVSQFNADNAACDSSRRSHQNMADAYVALIAASRNGALVDLQS